MNKRDREMMVMALAQNAPPDDADSVLSQALSGLQAEAMVLLEGITDSDDHDLLVLAYSHAYRIEALDRFFTSYMRAGWREPSSIASEAAE